MPRPTPTPTCVPCHPVARHLRHLLDRDPPVDVDLVAAAARVSRAFVLGVLDGTRPFICLDQARRLLGLDVADVRGAVAPPDPEEVRWLVGTLLAAGYPMGWQAARAGLSGPDLHRVLTEPDLAPSTLVAGRMRRLHLFTRGCVAGPERDGLTEDQIARAVNLGTRHGYHPPLAYDDQRRLLDGAVRPGPRQVDWAVVDEMVEQQLWALGELLKGTPVETVAGSGDWVRLLTRHQRNGRVRRLRDRLGLADVPVVAGRLDPAHPAVVRVHDLREYAATAPRDDLIERLLRERVITTAMLPPAVNEQRRRCAE